MCPWPVPTLCTSARLLRSSVNYRLISLLTPLDLYWVSKPRSYRQSRRRPNRKDPSVNSPQIATKTPIIYDYLLLVTIRLICFNYLSAYILHLYRNRVYTLTLRLAMSPAQHHAPFYRLTIDSEYTSFSIFTLRLFKPGSRTSTASFMKSHLIFSPDNHRLYPGANSLITILSFITKRCLPV